MYTGNHTVGDNLPTLTEINVGPEGDMSEQTAEGRLAFVISCAMGEVEKHMRRCLRLAENGNIDAIETEIDRYGKWLRANGLAQRLVFDGAQSVFTASGMEMPDSVS